MSFEQALDFVLAREGGFVDDPADPGGMTKYGISKHAYPNLDIRNLTPELAGEIYRTDYWGPAGCDAFNPGMALALFDAAVNCGVERAKGWAAEFPAPEDFLWRRVAYYRTLSQNKPSMLKFLPGWLRRLELLRDAIPTMT